MPPSLVKGYAAAHDEAIWRCFTEILGAAEKVGDQLARHVATLPSRLGGLGLRCAERTSPAAYLASWLDALPVLQEKLSGLARAIVEDLESDCPGPQDDSLAELRKARTTVESCGATGLPSWTQALVRTDPPGNPEHDNPRCRGMAPRVAVPHVFLS